MFQQSRKKATVYNISVVILQDLRFDYQQLIQYTNHRLDAFAKTTVSRISNQEICRRKLKNIGQ